MLCPLKADLSFSASPGLIDKGHCFGCPNSQPRSTLGFTVNQERPDVRKSTKESTKESTKKCAFNLTVNYAKPIEQRSTIFLIDCQHHCQLTQGEQDPWLSLSATTRPV